MIKLENVNLYYNKGKPSEVKALKSISLEIKKNDYAAFFGPSGCGKTTLLYAIAGMETSSVEGGSITINGKNILNFSAKEMAIFRQIGVGMVFQQFNLIPSLTVLDNVALPMAFLGISLERRREEAMKLLERLAIKNFASRYPSELSGGQQQRVGIARALANNAPIIIADEPLGNLDSDNANKVLDFLKELNEKDGRTIIMVTHEAWSIRDARKVFYMKDGEIIKTEIVGKKSDVAVPAASYFADKLQGSSHPSAGGNEVAARAFSNLFLGGYSINEIRRFEFFLIQRLSNKIDKDVFQAVIDRPYSEGGMGLWKQKAVKISKIVEELITRRKDLDDLYKKLEKDPTVSIAKEVDQLVGWLLEEYHVKLNETQMTRLNKVVADRIKNVIDGESFWKFLNLPKSNNGVGLSFRLAQKISEKFEPILTHSHNSLLNQING